MNQDKLKVLQIVPRLDLGGVERGTVDFSRYLVEKGHKSVVVSSGGRLVKKLVSEGTRHYTLPVNKKSFFSAFTCVGKVKDIILKEKINIVHCRSRVPDWIGFFASLKTPAQFLVTSHGYYSVHFFSRIVGLGKRVIAPSKTIARHLSEKFSISPGKIDIVYRGVKLEDFNFFDPGQKNPDKINLCFLGRIAPHKGVEYFIKAVNDLVKKYPNIKALIAGQASPKHRDYYNLLKKKAVWYGLTDKIEFLGRQDASAVLERSHILIVPSIGIPEPFGRVIIEAQAKGTACIATDSGGPAEIIKDAETGFLVPEYDYQMISEKARELIENKSLFNRMVYRARKRVEDRFTLELMSNKVIRIYREALSRKNILVVKISSLGDVVLGTATIRSLRKKFPSAYIGFLCSRAYSELLEGSGYIDEVIVCEDKNSRIKEALRVSSILRKKSLDIVVDVQNNHFSQVVTYLSLPKKSIGFSRKLSFLLDVKVDYEKASALSCLDSQAALLKPLGIEKIEFPLLRADNSTKRRVAHLLQHKGFDSKNRLVGINVQASFKWKTKNLKPDRLADLVAYFAGRAKTQVVLSGENYSWQKAERLRKKNPQKVINLCGEINIRELVAVVSETSLFISPDSAPFHIAVSLDIPVIGFFGPTDPAKHAVCRENIFILSRQKDLNCLFCYKKECRSRLCMDIELDKFKNIAEKVLN
jgi:ADP-heptose:LPS heptosyltransferase/glycosyltransferase involved in cell wall biosynthesis